jgi:hypothetical protein
VDGCGLQRRQLALRSENLTRCDAFRARNRLIPLCDSRPIDDDGPHQMARPDALGHTMMVLAQGVEP